jgi:L-asparagine oxygenase
VSAKREMTLPAVSGEWPDLARHVPDAAPDSAEFVRAAGHFGRLLPAAVHDALIDMTDTPPPVGALLIRGVPIGSVPLTPPTPWTPVDKDHTSDFALLALARRLGQPMGYAAESGGTLTPFIVPTTTDRDHQISTSSEVDLLFHTEGSYAFHRPRYLVLLCLRGDPAAATTLAPVASITALLDADTRAVLAQPRFRIAVDEMYVPPGDDPMTPPLAALSDDPVHPRLVFDADLMVGIDDEACSALARLSDAAAASRIDVALAAGDALVIDNHIAAHGRSRYSPRFDGSDRWLQRCFVMADPSISDGERDGRVITRAFGR